jgi:predicted nicotinamide N-methyase
MMTSATIQCAGIDVTLREYQTGGTGNRLWPASHALLRYLLDTIEDLDKSTFVELGAGVGLVSIALGKAGM